MKTNASISQIFPIMDFRLKTFSSPQHLRARTFFHINSNNQSNRYDERHSFYDSPKTIWRKRRFLVRWRATCRELFNFISCFGKRKRAETNRDRTWEDLRTRCQKLLE